MKPLSLLATAALTLLLSGVARGQTPAELPTPPAPIPPPPATPTPTPPPGAQPAASTPLDAHFATAAIWETPAGDFVQGNARPLGFRWLSSTRDAAQSLLPGAQIFGQGVLQTLLFVENDRFREITFILYNRGDAGSLSRADYDALIRRSIAAISEGLQTRFTPRGRDAGSAVRADGVTWLHPKAAPGPPQDARDAPAQTLYTLEYSATKTPAIPFRAEFVRLRLAPAARPKSLLEASFAADKKPGAFRGEEHLARDEAGGDVHIKDIPMVDQGQKGYCVAAATTRVLRYFGVQVDEHEMAQVADTSAEEGTSVRAMEESLKKLTARFKIRIRPVYELDHARLLAQYDMAARRAKAPPANPNVGSLLALYTQMRPEVLREARLRQRPEYTAFRRKVKAQIDEGMPVLWSVVLGLLPDGSKAGFPGGHMRLIIGYNEKTDELLFSDTWGPGHELKRMPYADAWAITTNAFRLEPIKP